eukprot:TRINITY_DN15579_c0_g1_i1.p1 TRINITY_DN15579_c0_g1~~TRINITY_DN15579_c0_g1_i1.p1  ORF type:complete len:209 (-),score=36.48 TRINITY_DN15579_c0_g1_i1:176-802(-)
MCNLVRAHTLVVPQVALPEDLHSLQLPRRAVTAPRRIASNAAREGVKLQGTPRRPAAPRPMGAKVWRSVAAAVSPSFMCPGKTEDAAPRRKLEPRSTPQATHRTQKRVRIDLSARTEHEITPYAEVYGIHPRDFAFERRGFVVLLAPGTGHWFSAATIRHAASYVESDDSDDDAAEEVVGDTRGDTTTGVWLEEDIVDDGWVLMCPGR